MQHPKIIIGTSKYRNYNIKYVRKLHSATSSTSQINHCNIQKILLQHHAAGPRRAQISGRRSRAHPWPQAPSPPRSSCGRGSHRARCLPRAPPRWSSRAGRRRWPERLAPGEGAATGMRKAPGAAARPPLHASRCPELPPWPLPGAPPAVGTGEAAGERRPTQPGAERGGRTGAWPPDPQIYTRNLNFD